MGIENPRQRQQRIAAYQDNLVDLMTTKPTPMPRQPYPEDAKWLSIFKRASSHSLWIREPDNGDVAISDGSMRIENRPETCDDGLILLDLEKPIQIQMATGWLGMCAMLANKGTDSSTPVGPEVTQFLLNRFGLRMHLEHYGEFYPAFLIDRLDAAIETDTTLSFMDEDGGLIVERTSSGDIHRMIMEPQISLKAALLALPDALPAT